MPVCPRTISDNLYGVFLGSTIIRTAKPRMKTSFVELNEQFCGKSMQVECRNRMPSTKSASLKLNRAVNVQASYHYIAHVLLICKNLRLMHEIEQHALPNAQHSGGLEVNSTSDYAYAYLNLRTVFDLLPEVFLHRCVVAEAYMILHLLVAMS